jgi:LAS superfamily LD-carboxypeptidase LdcB
MRRLRFYIVIQFFVFAVFFAGLYADESALPPDSVKISGKYYQIKPPWLGKKLHDESDPIPENLSMIPRQYAFDSSRIFVTKDTKAAFVAMVEQANRDGIFFKAKSGYRSYTYQRQIFAARLAKGRTFEQVCRNVAPPGYSQHMLGTAFDLSTDITPFANSEAYQWLKAHAADYGFEETYPENAPDGFSWEAWHWHYVGTDRDTLNNDTLH